MLVASTRMTVPAAERDELRPAVADLAPAGF